MRRTPHGFTIVVLAGAALGLLFAGFSTFDFAQNLDRQLHSIHCSFVPGLGKAGIGPSGCHATMMSAYSSVFRQSVWGGVPISLPAMSVFAFLLLYAVELCLTSRQEDPRAAGFLALAALLPAGASLVMASISFGVLGAACKLCMGIYFSSAMVLLGSVLMWRRALGAVRSGELDAMNADLERVQAARRAAGPGAGAGSPAGAPDTSGDPAWLASGGPAPAAAVAVPPADPMAATMMAPPGSPELQEVPARKPGTLASGRGGAAGRRRPSVTWGYLAAAFAVGVTLVAIPVMAYAALAPDHSHFIGTCGRLLQDKDPSHVMVPLDHNGGVPAIELLDPLCDHCRAFEQRLDSSGLEGEVHRAAVLFPLDSDCNWMLTDQVHPGACAVSEAVLCAGDRAGEVVDWSFDNQERLLAQARGGGDLRQAARQRFPELASCIGSPTIKARLNKSLRWAVHNQLKVLTPQLFIGGVKMCDEDTDLGLDYSLSRMIDRQRAGTLGKAGAR